MPSEKQTEKIERLCATLAIQKDEPNTNLQLSQRDRDELLKAMYETCARIKGLAQRIEHPNAPDKATTNESDGADNVHEPDTD